MRKRFLVHSTMAALALAGCGEDPTLCSLDTVQRALASASPGEVITLGACEIEGPFAIPAGVEVRGEGTLLRLSDASAGAGITLSEGAALRGVQVVSAGGTAILLRGGGSLDTIEVRSERGAALGVDGGSATLRNVRLVGPVEDPTDPRWVRVEGFAVPGACSGDCECTPGETRNGQSEVCTEDGAYATFAATYGLFVRGASVTLEDVDITGFALVGAVLRNATVRWNRGRVHNSMGTGILLDGGDATFNDLSVDAIAEGVRGTAAYGVIASGTNFDSARLQITSGERYGMLLDASPGAHQAFVAEGNGDVGLWVGETTNLELGGDLRNNAFAGLVVAQSADLRVEGLNVEGTRSVRRTLGDAFGSREVGDGIHIQGSRDLSFRDIVVADNARVGLLADLAEGTPRFERVEVETNDGFGAIGGSARAGELNPDAPDGWDEGIRRGPRATVADVAFATPLPLITVATPPTAVEQALGVIPMF